MTGRNTIDNLDNVKIDEELRDLLPPLTPDEFQKLEESILKNGVLDPFKVWGDEKTGEKYLIDGHNRKTICDKHDIKINYWNIQYFDSSTFKNKEEVIVWIIENQLGRRNLSDAERYEIVQKYKPIFEAKAKENMSAGGKGSTNLPKVDTRKEMAKMVGVSEGTYAKIDKVMKSHNEDIKKKVRADEISIDAAYKEVKPKVDVKKTLEVIPKEPKQVIPAEQLTKNSTEAEKGETYTKQTYLIYKRYNYNSDYGYVGEILLAESIFDEDEDYPTYLKEQNEDELLSAIDICLLKIGLFEDRCEKEVILDILDRQTLEIKANVEFLYGSEDEYSIKIFDVSTDVLDSVLKKIEFEKESKFLHYTKTGFIEPNKKTVNKLKKKLNY